MNFKTAVSALTFMVLLNQSTMVTGASRVRGGRSLSDSGSDKKGDLVQRALRRSLQANGATATITIVSGGGSSSSGTSTTAPTAPATAVTAPTSTGGSMKGGMNSGGGGGTTAAATAAGSTASIPSCPTGQILLYLHSKATWFCSTATQNNSVGSSSSSSNSGGMNAGSMSTSSGSGGGSTGGSTAFSGQAFPTAPPVSVTCQSGQTLLFLNKDNKWFCANPTSSAAQQGGGGDKSKPKAGSAWEEEDVEEVALLDEDIASPCQYEETELFVNVTAETFCVNSTITNSGLVEDNMMTTTTAATTTEATETTMRTAGGEFSDPFP